MKVSLDTSVIVAGLLSSHVLHDKCWPWLEQASQGAFEWILPTHSLAEVYSVLTRMPLRPKLSPAVVHQLLNDSVLPYAKLQSLGADDYREVIDRLVAAGLGGGITYDALQAQAANIAQVDLLVTSNIKHFRQVWPAGAQRITSPEITAPPGFEDD